MSRIRAARAAERRQQRLGVLFLLLFFMQEFSSVVECVKIREPGGAENGGNRRNGWSLERALALRNSRGERRERARRIAADRRTFQQQFPFGQASGTVCPTGATGGLVPVNGTGAQQTSGTEHDDGTEREGANGTGITETGGIVQAGAAGAGPSREPHGTAACQTTDEKDGMEECPLEEGGGTGVLQASSPHGWSSERLRVKMAEVYARYNLPCRRGARLLSSDAEREVIKELAADALSDWAQLQRILRCRQAETEEEPQLRRQPQLDEEPQTGVQPQLETKPQLGGQAQPEEGPQAGGQPQPGERPQPGETRQPREEAALGGEPQRGNGCWQASGFEGEPAASKSASEDAGGRKEASDSSARRVDSFTRCG